MAGWVMRKGDRVLTRFGYGRLSAITSGSHTAELDNAFAGGSDLEGRFGEFVQVWGSILVRVVNIGGFHFTNTVLLPSSVAGVLWGSPCPPDECRFLINSGWRTIFQNWQLGDLVSTRYIFLNSWVDRWGSNDPLELPIQLKVGQSIEAWLREQQEMWHSTSGAIAYYAVLDRERRTLVWHSFLCECGLLPVDTLLESSEP